MSKPLRLLIDARGEIFFLHDDALLPVMQEGQTRTVRASHVEPGPDGRQWFADLSPQNGPNLGPFPTRTEALAAEVAWIEKHVFFLAPFGP